jgi:hypothetical protein
MELDDQSPETPESPKKNIAAEIKSLRDEIQKDNDGIMKYTAKITDPNRINQYDIGDYENMIDYYEERRNTNLELLKTKIQELLNHPLNTISPSSKKRERTSSQSGGTKKHRRKNKNKNKNKRKRTMRR